METLLALIVGALFAGGTYLVLRRNLLQFVFGLVMLGNAANLLIFTAGRLTRGAPPLIYEGMLMREGPFANPLPQALVLTAIVISFGLTAFTLVLVLRGYTTLGSADTEVLEVPAVPAYKSAAVAAEETAVPEPGPGSRAPDTTARPGPSNPGLPDPPPTAPPDPPSRLT